MTTTLAEEVGTPDDANNAPAAGNTPTAEGSAEPVAKEPEVVEEAPEESLSDTEAEPAASDEAPAEAAVAESEGEEGSEAGEAETSDAGSAAEEGSVEQASGTKADDPDDTDDTGAQAQIDQEINQALEQLKGGTQPSENKTAAPAAVPEKPAADSPGLLRRVGRLCIRAFDILLTPVALLCGVLDLPFGWLPKIVRQLLGFVALGTAAMAGGLWVYILIWGH